MPRPIWLNKNARRASDSSFFNPTILRVTRHTESGIVGYQMSYNFIKLLTALIDIECLFTCGWVGSDEGMLMLNGLPPHHTVPVAGKLYLLKT
jgi:hypothetical protein